MRPRRRRRGEPVVEEAKRLRREELKCGHGGDAVENKQQPAYEVWNSPLQCGHGGDAVENEDGNVRDLLREQASMRPRRRRRGEPRALQAGVTNAERFNAATAATPWRTWRRTAGSTGLACFNAATAATPWR